MCLFPCPNSSVHRRSLYSEVTPHAGPLWCGRGRPSGKTPEIDVMSHCVAKQNQELFNYSFCGRFQYCPIQISFLLGWWLGSFFVQTLGGSTLLSLTVSPHWLDLFLPSPSADKPSLCHTDVAYGSDTDLQAGCPINDKGAPLRKRRRKQDGEEHSTGLGNVKTFLAYPFWLP